MQKKPPSPIAAVFLLCAAALLPCARMHGQSPNEPYPAMAPLDRYLIPTETEEIALARSAAPPSLSNDAEIMVLRRDGYATAVKGGNGFLCLVERSWANSTDDAQFWNPKMRAPHCFNAAAARTFAPIYLMKTKLVLSGKSRQQIAAAVASALDRKEIPPIEPGAMAYMMSKQQYLNDRDACWHPHTMFFFPGDASKSWAADLSDSPVIAGNDAEERITILFVLADRWSDGSKAPPMMP